MKLLAAGLVLSMAASSYASETIFAKDLKPITYQKSDTQKDVSLKLADFCGKYEFEAAALMTKQGVVDVGSSPYRIVEKGEVVKSSIIVDAGEILSRAIDGRVTLSHCHPTIDNELLYPSHFDIMNASMILIRMKQLDIPLSNIRFQVVSKTKDGVEGVEYWPNGLFKPDVSKIDPLNTYQIDPADIAPETYGAMRDLREFGFAIENALSFLNASDEFDSKMRHTVQFRKRLEERVGPISDKDAYFAYLSASSTFQYKTFFYPKDFNTQNTKD